MALTSSHYHTHTHYPPPHTLSSPTHYPPPTHAHHHPAHTQLLIGYDHNYLELWDALTWKPISIYGPIKGEEEMGDILATCWHSSGTQFLTSHQTGEISFWNLSEKERPFMIKRLHGGWTSSMLPWLSSMLSKWSNVLYELHLVVQISLTRSYASVAIANELYIITCMCQTCVW